MPSREEADSELPDEKLTPTQLRRWPIGDNDGQGHQEIQLETE